MAKKKRKLKKYIIIAIIVGIVIFFYYNIQKNAKEMVNEYTNSSIIEELAKYETIEIKLTGNGTIKPNGRCEIIPELPGEVKEQYVQIGEIVSKDDDLFKIGNMKVKSPISGTLITSNIEEGDYYQLSTTSKDPVIVVANIDKVKFDMEVDELDINKVEKGMNVKVQADAVPNQIFDGVVTKIATEGKSQNGVTTYDVTVEIENYGDLKLGMNVDASIVVERKENVLTIPMEAINKNDEEVYVYVKDENYVETENKNTVILPNSMADVPGYKKKNVQIGISNKDYAEITSGLAEGDKVYYISNSKTLTEYMMMETY